jgi:hypothetical protein
MNWRRFRNSARDSGIVKELREREGIKKDSILGWVAGCKKLI